MAARGSMVASGSIFPSTFVKFDTTAGNTGKCLQAGAGDVPCGVSQQGTRNAPYPGLDDGYCAIAGETLRVYTASDPEDMPLLQVDAAYPQGTLLKPGTNGIGTIANTDKDCYGAVQMEASTAANQLVQVRVIAPEYVAV